MKYFAVVQTRFETLSPEALTDVLTGPGGMTHPDAKMAVRRHQGILWDRFDQVQAEAVQKELSERGFGVEMIASDAIPELGDVRVVRWFGLDEDALHIPVGIRGQTVPIYWENVYVLTLNQIAKVTKRPVSDVPESASSTQTRSYLISRDTRPHYQKRSQLIDVLDIIALDDTGVMHYLRLPSNELSFERIMGEGTNLNRFERFLVIVDYCVTHARDAVVSPQTRKALVTQQPTHVEVDGDGMQAIQQESIENRNRWLLLRALTEEFETGGE